MFNFRHPKPVVDGRAVAVQVVQQKAAPPPTPVLVAEHAPPALVKTRKERNGDAAGKTQ
jgi:hypothetical protein